MSAAAFMSLLVLVVVLLISVGPLGRYMANVYGDDKAPGDRLFLPWSGWSTGSCAWIPSASSVGTSTRSRCSRSASFVGINIVDLIVTALGVK